MYYAFTIWDRKSLDWISSKTKAINVQNDVKHLSIFLGQIEQELLAQYCCVNFTTFNTLKLLIYFKVSLKSYDLPYRLMIKLWRPLLGCHYCYNHTHKYHYSYIEPLNVKKILHSYSHILHIKQQFHLGQINFFLVLKQRHLWSIQTTAKSLVDICNKILQ